MATIHDLKTKYRAELCQLESRLTEVKAKLHLLEELDEQPDYQIVPPGPSSPLELVIPEQLTAACEWIVRKHGVSAALSTGDVRRFLDQYGYKNESPNFPVTLMKTMKRLVDTSRIKGDKVGHNWEFRSP
jgi:hypothetical protein